MKKALFRGGVLLGMSALLSKFIGLWRDRLVLDIFSVETTDLVFMAFRVPDFFYYLLVGATVSVVFLPRYVELNKKEKDQYLSSFFWGIFFFFGGLSLCGILMAESLVKVFATGLPAHLQSQVAGLSQYLFGSVFLLSLSSVFAAALQAKEKFIALSLGPLFYTFSIAGGLYIFRDAFGIFVIGYAAILGALAHLTVNMVAYFHEHGHLNFHWKRPERSWKNWHVDFSRRVLNNVAFQLNQTADLWIASFLIMGAVTSFSLGTNLGHFLLTIVGLSVANSVFPSLAKFRNNPKKERVIIAEAARWILFLSIPVAVIFAFGAETILQLVYNLDGERLAMTKIVFLWTVITLPFACLIPLFSRVFLANDDTKTPLYVNITSLSLATLFAAFMSLVVLPPDKAILGLALGNFFANVLSVGLFSLALWHKYFEDDEYRKLSHQQKHKK